MAGFNDMVGLSCKQAHTLLGGVDAIYNSKGMSTRASVLIDHGVEVVNDSGTSFTRRTVIDIKKTDVQKVEIGAVVSGENFSYTIGGFIAEDEHSTQVYVS